MPGSVPPPSVRARRTSRVRNWWLPVLLGVLFGLSTGTAAAYGPQPISGFSTNDGFVILSYQSLLTPQSVNAGDLVFADTLYLQFVNFGENRTVQAQTTQTTPDGANSIFFNATYSVVRQGVTTVTFDLPSSTTLRHTKLCVDGGCITFDHETPRTLVPSGVLNIGGLDLLIFSVVFETFVLIVPSTIVARHLTHKALWTPKATLLTLLGLPHVIFGLVLLLWLDYPLVDGLFSGTQFLVFPPLFSAFYFFWVLHLFNVAVPALVLRPDPQGGHRLRFNAWSLWVGELPDGTRIMVGTRWRDWLARLFGHAPVLVPANVDASKRGGPAENDLSWFHVYGRRFDARRFRREYGRTSPLDDFRIAGEEIPMWRGILRPKFLYWVDTDAWLDVEMSRLSIHRTVPTPARTLRDGSVEPAGTREKLTWPHYVDPPAGTMKLAARHYDEAPAAAMGFTASSRLAKRVHDLRLQVWALRGTPYVTADEMAEEYGAELLKVVERERRPLSDAEAEEDARTGPPRAEGTVGIDEAETSERPKPKKGKDGLRGGTSA